MVVPEHPAAAAQAAATGRLTRLLGLAPGGVLVRAVARRRDDLPGFVRAMRARLPELRVITGLAEIGALGAGPAVVLLHADEAQSANLLRPVFARARVVAWSLAADERELRSRAPDLLDIASAWIELPAFGPPPFAVAGLRAVLADRAARAAVWTGGDPDEALAAIGARVAWLAADAPWSEKVAAASVPGWVAWTGVDDPPALDAVRWAHAGRAARALIVSPRTPVRGVWHLTGSIADPRGTGERGARLDFEAEALDLPDQGIDRLAAGAAVTRREAPAPVLRAAVAAGTLATRPVRSWKTAPIAAVRVWAWTGETRRCPSAGTLSERDRLAFGPALVAGASPVALARLALEDGHRDVAAALGDLPWIRGLVALAEHRYADAAAELDGIPGAEADRAAVARALGAPPAEPARLVLAARRASRQGRVAEGADLRTAALLQRGRLAALDAEADALAHRVGTNDHPLVWKVRFRAARLAVAQERPDAGDRMARLEATGRRAVASDNPRFRLYQAIVFSSAPALEAARRAYERSGLIHSREATALLAQEIQRAWRAADREGAATVAGDLVTLALQHGDAVAFALGRVGLARTRGREVLTSALTELKAIDDPARPKAERLVLAALAEGADDEEAVILLRRALSRGADPWLRLALIERLTRLGRYEEAAREKARLAASRDPRAVDARRRLAMGDGDR